MGLFARGGAESETHIRKQCLQTRCSVRRVYFDTETTGLSAADGDEVLELAVISDEGKKLLNTLVRPEVLTEWPEAQAIHGITPAAVQRAPTLEEIEPRLIAVLRGAEVVIYNAEYDMSFMSREVRAAPAKVSCAMRRFARCYGEWSAWRRSYKWQPLHRAAAYVHHTWQGAAHRALADTYACRAVWHYLTDKAEARRVDALRRAAANPQQSLGL